ncbi:MAG TPA: SOS response-associated peptidase [Acidimicrobiales bacterium]
MCGRFVAATPPSALAERFQAELAPELAGDGELGPRFNVAPTLPVYAVAASRRTGARRLGAFRWGLVPSWAADPSVGSRMINARVETVATRPAFRPALLRRRCIIPADAFYEWQRRGGRTEGHTKQTKGHTRQPFAIRRRDGGLLPFAGLWEMWRAEDAPHGSPLLRTCTIITTPANDAVASLHDRMPAILAPGAWDEWLDPAACDLSRLLRLLQPASPADFAVYPVSTEVNNARNEGAQLVLPIEPGG